VSIYSIDGDVQAEDLEAVSKPNHLFVLTPLHQAKPLPERKPLLPADV
jgi:hypothetical protein